MSGSGTSDLTANATGPVLVTGATGFIGSQLALKLHQHGYQVRALHRPDGDLAPLAGLPIEPIVGDLFDPASLDRACDGVAAVFHCAAQVAGWRRRQPMVDSHIGGTRNMLKAALRRRVPRLIYVSSAASLGIPHLSDTDPNGGMRETHVWNCAPASWPYGYAKAMAEIEVWRSIAGGLDAVIVCPAIAIGPGDHKRLRDGLFHMTLTGRPLPFTTRGGLNVIDLPRALEGMILAWQRGRTGRRYLLTGYNLSFTEFLTALAHAAGVRPPKIEIPAGLLRRVGTFATRMPILLKLMPAGGMLSLAGYHLYFDNQATETELQLPPAQPLAQMLSSTVAWTRQQLRLPSPNK